MATSYLVGDWNFWHVPMIRVWGKSNYGFETKNGNAKEETAFKCGHGVKDEQIRIRRWPVGLWEIPDKTPLNTND